MLDRKLIPKNQLLTQEDSNISQGIAKSVTPKYKVKVTFDSITVKNDREGAGSGNGEFDLSVFVQGKRVDLTGGTSASTCTHLVPGPVTRMGPTYLPQKY